MREKGKDRKIEERERVREKGKDRKRSRDMKISREVLRGFMER